MVYNKCLQKLKSICIKIPGDLAVQVTCLYNFQYEGRCCTMKLEFGPYIKSLCPATATVDIKVTELAEGERFDEETLRNVTAWIVQQHQPLYDIMDHEGHQTFWGVYNFHHEGQTITVRMVPLAS